MKALVHHGPGKRSWKDYPDPDLMIPAAVPRRQDTDGDGAR